MIQMTHFSHRDYQAVCDFLIALNRQHTHINWNWARWEWMHCHPYCDRDALPSIGLWKDGEAIVGAAIFDLYHGEAFCGALKEYRHLLPEIMAYAYTSLGDGHGLGVPVNDADEKMQALLESLGYHKADQTETVLCLDLEKLPEFQLPHGFSIKEIHFPEDNLAYQTVIWKGFDHEGDDAELEKMLCSTAPLPPHRTPFLCLAVIDSSGEFAAHCTCWYDERTSYAYVEPVCTVPAHRGKGLGRSVALEALTRCKKLGAKEAFVISEQEFYRKMGFIPYSRYTFYWKN